MIYDGLGDLKPLEMSDATRSLHLENQKRWHDMVKKSMIGVSEMFGMEDTI